MDYGSKWPESHPHYYSAPVPASVPASASTPVPAADPLSHPHYSSAPVSAADPLPQHYPAPPSTIHQPYHHHTHASTPVPSADPLSHHSHAHYSSAPVPAADPLPQHYPAPPSTTHQPYHHLTPSYYYTNPNPNSSLPPPNVIPAYDIAAARIPHSSPLENPFASHGGYSYPPLGRTPLMPHLHYYGARAGVGAGDPHGFSGKESIQQYGIDPASYYSHYSPAPLRPYDGLVPYGMPSASTPHNNAHSYSGGARRDSRKMTKVVQSAYCEVCKADCTSQDDLNNHKQGKRHKKNLQKLQDSITPKSQKLPATTNAVETKESAGDIGEQKKRKEASQAMEEDLETKKRKMVESGATADGVRVCTICNIVVNSQKVYDFHIAGQRHIAMARQQKEVVAS